MANMNGELLHWLTASGYRTSFSTLPLLTMPSSSSLLAGPFEPLCSFHTFLGLTDNILLRFTIYCVAILPEGGVEVFSSLTDCLWLAVKGPDQTARVVSRKKHRSKRKTITSEIEATCSEAEQRVRELWKLSNRRFRRWMNDRLLRELAPPLDSQEIGSLFAPPPWGERSTVTPFERVTGLGDNAAYDMAAWEPFRNNVDMDFQAQVLQPPTRLHKCNEDSIRHALALTAWQTVERHARSALRRSSCWHLVQAFEEKVLTFLRDVENGHTTTLAIEVDDPYHRLLLHGVCQFHGLLSQSVSTWEERRENNKVTLVTRMHIRKKKSWRPLDPSNSQQNKPLSLIDFLRGVKKQIPSPCAAA